MLNIITYLFWEVIEYIAEVYKKMKHLHCRIYLPLIIQGQIFLFTFLFWYLKFFLFLSTNNWFRKQFIYVFKKVSRRIYLKRILNNLKMAFMLNSGFETYQLFKSKTKVNVKLIHKKQRKWGF